MQHRVVLCAERDHNSRILRPLALVDGRRIGEDKLIEFAKPVGDWVAVEIDVELACLHVDA